VIAVRLISWNIWQGGGGRIARQIESLTAQNPDVIALQEVFVSTDGEYREELYRFGYEHAISSFEIWPDCHALGGARRYGELVLSKWPLTLVAGVPFSLPWPERVLSVKVNSPRTAFDLHVVHVPNGSKHEQVKRETFEGLYKGLSRSVGHPRVLCGDFCAPQLERADCTIVTWAYKEQKNQKEQADVAFKLRPERGERWDVAERSILLGLAEFDLPDTFRLKHRCDELAYSIVQRNRETVNLRRYDHIFASRELQATSCEYLHAFREEGLSDHSPIQADFGAV
jgi:endonuclease/exonuclease/phosphatase family metal-dependent hydrolase